MFDASRVLEPAFQAQPASFFWQSTLANVAVDEDNYLAKLIFLAQSDVSEQKSVAETAESLIRRVREQDDSVHMIDALLQEYSLDTQEGILLMCLTEALMRIPDKPTADALIRDKMTEADWNRHLGRSESTLVNASTWGLLLTGRVVRMDRELDGSPSSIWKRLVRRSGEPVIRRALNQAMAIMGRQFVLGQDIDRALDHGLVELNKGHSYSFDMLGESALTADDAKAHVQRYLEAIEAVGEYSRAYSDHQSRALPLSVSVKLSALHPRFEASQRQRVLEELYPSLCELVEAGRAHGVAITLDAEEMDRFELTLELFRRIYQSPVAAGWSNLGLAVQAYSKRALPTLCWLNKLAKAQGDEIPVRLVKGAYWDAEIKLAQQQGLDSYPVFTRKEGTDTSYLACLRFLLSEYTRGGLYPQLATHNAHTLASVLAMSASRSRRIELQRLHGMGGSLYDVVLAKQSLPVRIYAPVGGHKDLLPYLVRRLLENGANSSFVHRLVDAETPIEALVKDPVQELQKFRALANDRIPSPPFLYGSDRRNAKGWNLSAAHERDSLLAQVDQWRAHQWRGGPLIAGHESGGDDTRAVQSPLRSGRKVGELGLAGRPQMDEALVLADEGWVSWSEVPVAERAEVVARFARLVEDHCPELIALCAQETGMPLRTGLEELRDTVDTCRYYASQARACFGQAVAMPGPTGERNELFFEGRGVFLCISPGSSPMAVFCGQIAAALVSGNTVLAKPSSRAGLVAFRLAELWLEAGVPTSALQLLPGDGALVGDLLIPDPRIAGVAFTGSIEAACAINRALVLRQGPGAPLIADTGGYNAMIADSSALSEQIVRDALRSAFGFAGQRGSALDVLCVQEDVADHTERLLAGAVRELSVDDPMALSTDVGPCGEPFGMDAEAQSHSGRLIGQARMPEGEGRSHWALPAIWAIKSPKYLKNTQFGPTLYLVRYRADELDRTIDELNRLGNCRTLSIHSRSESTAAYIEKRVRSGNTYINRDQASAVARPHYLLRFASERTRTINTTALGGNASLMSLGIQKI